ncbi:hypothetical protein [Kineosporia babensis]|uniref:Uncharacterized protein n=1 Tax=Kineosporia babensis TaxID=499548 RepID=A0A9X1SSN3_9ACTN|nr:hypothetical protein [Kineosporia babensis]MCD5310842.1 hypothetical protein [Kineosporia babensis]
MTDTPAPPPPKRGRGRPGIGPKKNVNLRPDQHAAIKAIAERGEVEEADVIRDLLDEALTPIPRERTHVADSYTAVYDRHHERCTAPAFKTVLAALEFLMYGAEYSKLDMVAVTDSEGETILDLPRGSDLRDELTEAHDEERLAEELANRGIQ